LRRTLQQEARSRDYDDEMKAKEEGERMLQIKTMGG
jgi:hypothetical protein